MNNYKRQYCFCALILSFSIMTGCASVAPVYVAKNENIRVLQSKPGAKIGAGDILIKKENADRLNQLTIRGGGYTSPYQDSFANYLKEALIIELRAAGRWDPSSTIKISGELLENDLDGSGMNTGTARVGARFIIDHSGVTAYNKVLTADHSWESSFMGAIAIPKARENYVATVQKLLGMLFSDAEFLDAIR